MKRSGIVVIVCISWQTLAMENYTSNQIIESNKQETRIQFDDNNMDNELQDIEQLSFQQEAQNHIQLFEDTLSQLPFFAGKEKNDINGYVHLIKQQNPIVYGQITQMILNKKEIHNRSYKISKKNLETIDQKIQHALLQVALENQKIAAQSRIEDLVQAKKDRKTVGRRWLYGVIAGVPGTVLSIIALVKAFN